MSAKPFATKAPAKNEDTATFRFVKENVGGTDEELLFVYVPEDVCEDVNSLYGRKVTIIFGDDNEAVAIKNIDKVVENEYLTAYEDLKVTVAGEDYKFATGAKVFVNTIEMTNKNITDNYDCLTGNLAAADATANAVMPVILEILEVEDATEIEKVVEANIVFDAKGTKVARLDLFVSGEYTEFNTHEGVVEKVSKEVIHLSNNGEISYKNVEEEDLPTVVKDGEYIEITDIVAGDVLTYYGANVNTADTIYVSSEKAEGKVSTIRKANKAIKIAEGTFAPSTTTAVMTTKALKDGAWDIVDTTKVVKNDEVVIYLNIYGEYCAISLEKEISDWEFGIATLVYEKVDYEGDNDEIETRAMKILTQDATNAVKYTVKADTSSDEIKEGDLAGLVNDTLVHELVMFKADADRNIDFEDLYIVNSSTIAGLNTEFVDQYVFKETVADTYVAGKRIDLDGVSTIAAVDYRYSAATTLFNVGKDDVLYAAADPEIGTKYIAAKDGNLTVVADTATPGANEIKVAAANTDKAAGQTTAFVAGDKIRFVKKGDVKVPGVDVEVVNDWDSIISSNDFVDTAIIVAEDGETVPVCIALLVEAYTTSDAVYAMVEVDAYETEDEDYVTLIAENGSEEVDLHKNLADAKLDEMYKNAFIEYKTTSDKISDVKALVNVKAFNKLADKDDSTVTSSIVASGIEAVLVNDLDGTGSQHVRYENFTATEIIVDEDDFEIVYKEINDPETNQVEQMASLFLEKGKVTVYDLRDGFTVISMNDLVDEVNGEDYDNDAMIIAFKNLDQPSASYDANILVIL